MSHFEKLNDGKVEKGELKPLERQKNRQKV
jgi:hypothetical protein